MAKIYTRNILWYLSLSGIVINFLNIINLNLVIVEMVRPNLRQSEYDFDDFYTCLDKSNNNTNYTYVKSNLTTRIDDWKYLLNTSEHENNTELISVKLFSLEKAVLDLLNIKYSDSGFLWNEHDQSLILGSFFLLYWVAMTIISSLVKYYSAKLLFGLPILISAWIGVLIPIFSYWNYKALIILRVLQGLIAGFSLPTIHYLTVHWMPPNEKNQFSDIYKSVVVSLAIFNPLFGYIMAWISWEWIFHICALISTIWYIFWLIIFHDTPSRHPRISFEERHYIEMSMKALKESSKSKRMSWKNILLAPSVWINGIMNFGSNWTLFTKMTQIPTYFKNLFDWKIENIGLVSGLPYIALLIFARLLSTQFVNKFIKRNQTKSISHRNVNRTTVAICCLVQCMCICGLAFSGCSSIAASVFLTLSIMFQGTDLAGPIASMVDIAPQYAGILLCITGITAAFTGFISPTIVGVLTLNHQSTNWKYVFLLLALILFTCKIFYIVFHKPRSPIWKNTAEKSNPKDEKCALLYNKYKAYYSSENLCN